MRSLLPAATAVALLAFGPSAAQGVKPTPAEAAEWLIQQNKGERCGW